MTLRHDIKIRQGDSWTSPTWAVVMPGGLGVDLTDGWTVRAQAQTSRASTEAVYVYSVDNGGVDLGQAEVTLSNGAVITTSTVELHHPGTTDLPVFVGPWDCDIRKGDETYTIAEGTYRVIRDVTT